MKTAVVYARVSSREQAEGFSIDAQIKACKNKALDEGYKVLRVFKDEGFTGTNKNRPALRTMLDYCKDNSVNVVIIHKLDRFARSVVDHSAIRAVLMRYSTNLLSCSEQLGTAPHEVFLENIMASMAQYYSDNLKTEVRKGIVERFECGYHLSTPPFGYEVRTGSKVMQIIPEKATIIRKIFDTYNTRAYSYGEIAQKLYDDLGFKSSSGKPVSRSRIQEILRNIIYAGMVEYKKVNKKVEGLHEPIVSMDTYLLAEEIMNERGNVKKCAKHKYIYIYKGFIRCPECGRNLQAGYSRSHTGKKYLYYFCRNKEHGAVNIQERDINHAFQKELPKLRMDKKVMDVINFSFKTDLNDKEKLGKQMLLQRKKILNDIEEKRLALCERLENELITENIYKVRDSILENQFVQAQRNVNETSIDYNDVLTKVRMLTNFGAQIDRYWEIASFEHKVQIMAGLFLNPPRYKDLNLVDYEISPLYQAVSSVKANSVQLGRGGGT